MNSNPSNPSQSTFQSTHQPVGCVAYGIGGLSFIPLIGIPFGLVAIIWGVVRSAWGLACMGVAGILFSVVLYGSLFYFGFHQRGGVYDELRGRMAVTMLNDLVKEIEFYKLQHGHYPAALSEFNTKDTKKPVFTMDPTAMQRGDAINAFFFYELEPEGKFYFLRSVGADGVPFTADDVLPSLSEEERKNTGLHLER